MTTRPAVVKLREHGRWCLHAIMAVHGDTFEWMTDEERAQNLREHEQDCAALMKIAATMSKKG